MIITLKNLLEHQDLGTKGQLALILKTLYQAPKLKTDLKQICLDSDFYFSQSFDGAIALLQYLKFIINAAEKFISKSNIKLDNFEKNMLEEFFLRIASEKQLHFIFSPSFVIQYKEKILITLVPIKYSSIRNFLINIGFMNYDNIFPNYLCVKSPYLDFFRDDVSKLIEKSSLQTNSLENFKEIQNNKEKNGRDAENFVLEYEKRIRKNHIKVNNIKIVSNEDVSAGYDILSYLYDKSLILDKFIEVKSYSKQKHFYWSYNEVQVAKEKQDNYFLYLVNIDKIKINKNYRPIIIKNPYAKRHKYLKQCHDWYVNFSDLNIEQGI